MHRRFVMTGGPGAGKSALLAALAGRGHAVVAESARAIIRDRKARGLSPRPAPVEFAQAILRMDVDRYVAAPVQGLVFFDRGIPDALGMLHETGFLPENERERYLRTYRYSQSAFVLPPWEEIYHTDDERDQTFGDAVRVYDGLCRWYRSCGFELVIVPKATIEERCDFLLTAASVA